MARKIPGMPGLPGVQEHEAVSGKNRRAIRWPLATVDVLSVGGLLWSGSLR